MNPNDDGLVLTDEQFGDLIGFLADRGHIDVIVDLLTRDAYEALVAETAKVSA